jgi:putative transposase
MIEWQSEMAITTQAELLGLNRTSLYYEPVPVSAEEVAIKHRIDELYTAHPFLGSRKLSVILSQELGPINRKAVQRHMQEMGIAGICPGPNLSKRRVKAGLFPYLLRGMPIDRPNQVFGIDITYIRLHGGWLYMVAVLDWYSRYVVAWELDQTLEMDFVLSTVDRALAIAKPDIWNSDQGSHFTSPQYIERLQAAQVRISMDGKGRAADNIFTERFWRSLKYEEIYLNDYDSPRQAQSRLATYMGFYNQARPHQALGYLTPAQVYFGHAVADQKTSRDFVLPPAIQIG